MHTQHHHLLSHFLVPRRGNMIVGMEEGVSMKAWSLESFVPRANECPGSHAGRGCYFILYARGFGKGEFTFWIEVEVSWMNGKRWLCQG